MKLVLLLAVCAAATASPKIHEDKQTINNLKNVLNRIPDGRNILADLLIRQLFEFILSKIKYGWPEHGIPVLDPLNIESFHLELPAGIINLDIQLEKVHATGFSQFVVHKSVFNGDEISFDVVISFPALDISADKYDLDGDFLTAVPLYGSGEAKFHVSQFTFEAKLYLKQSPDGKSILIDRIENGVYYIPDIKCNLTGVIGGGDIDKVVNELLEDVIFNYVNRFHGAIASVMSRVITTLANPFLAELDSWKYIEILLPPT